MSHAKLIGVVFFAGISVILAACGGKIRYPSYYVLNLPPPAPQPAQSKPSLGSAAVRQFSAPRFLRAGAIVYCQSPEQLGFYNYERWAVDPRSVVTSAFVQVLESRSIFQSVHPSDGGAISDYLITGTLDHLEEVDEGHRVSINVSISAQLINVKTGNVVWSDASSQTTSLEDHAMARLVAGMSQAAEQAITNLVSSMQGRLLQLQASASKGIKEARQE
jgi:cholesterol transport system auxiliary component